MPLHPNAQLHTRESLPDGCTSHIFAFGPEDGATIAELWVSHESFNSFVESQLPRLRRSSG